MIDKDVAIEKAVNGVVTFIHHCEPVDEQEIIKATVVMYTTCFEALKNILPLDEVRRINTLLVEEAENEQSGDTSL